MEIDMNDKAIKVMKKLSAQGITDKKSLSKFGLEDFVKSDLSKSDLDIVTELQSAVNNDLFAYLMQGTIEE